MPGAAPAAALSSSWFCAGATGAPAQVADGQLAVANSTDRNLQGTVTLVPSQGQATTVPIKVASHDRTIVPEAPAGPAPFVGAIVDLDGGGASVEQIVGGAQGLSTAPCASSGSDHWYFADGTTQEGSTLSLALLNPYTDDAIVDLSFTTEVGAESPADFQGLVVPARSLTSVDLGSHLRGRAGVATTVATRAGRVVAFKTQVINPLPNRPPQTPADPNGGALAPPRPPGLSLVLGTPSPSKTWYWPDGVTAAGVTERYQIYNPNATEASVSLAVELDQGSANPFQLKVPPHGTTTLLSNAQSRIPEGVAHAAILRSDNGVPVVAERTIDAIAPSPRTGLADLLGSPLTSRHWLFAAGSADPATDEWLIIFNPGLSAARVSVLGLGGAQAIDLGGQSEQTVPPGRRVSIRINDHSPAFDKAITVQASTPVIVERDLYLTKHIGINATIGVPLDQ
jgi:hypothetical protein